MDIEKRFCVSVSTSDTVVWLLLKKHEFKIDIHLLSSVQLSLLIWMSVSLSDSSLCSSKIRASFHSVKIHILFDMLDLSCLEPAGEYSQLV